MSTPDRKARDAEKVARRRQSLIEAAITVIARKGLPGMTLADVAREAGCGYGLVSFHFETKERLLLASLDALVEEYRAAWHARSDAHADAAAKLEALIDLDLGSDVGDERHIAVWTAFWAETPRNADYKTRFSELNSAYLARLEPLISALAAAEPACTDHRLIAGGLSALFDGLWIDSQTRGQGEVDWNRARATCRAYLRAFFPKSFGPETDWRP
ncbi:MULTISPECIES: TetR family transcriptional regulator C-terminal domain-containing protein [unclassified Mesorhizobium]|uniref:TetR family transcriptional regulator C-terminal domain-containing protein n=1 Tax=unclassified Mesorhizobium TaxID=325217 RepID=UPI001CCD3080|nr:MULTISPECIES: TetR family transcriptional regulator C-terminal domain-containing protein [unclassified Mesorhizobium]MBZ9737907.1 TetR family transcriptional regulator C-terminal domain-containing protein [Mesorhizobium sp. CO1-1-4]MBZ9801906.1 TetR family transcriptional regulator C-terminal domain-containing protein [Mesorhizobium sp. ES1-6]